MDALMGMFFFACVMWAVVFFAKGMKDLQKRREEADMRKISPEMYLRLKQMDHEKEIRAAEAKKASGERIVNGAKLGLGLAERFLKK